MAACLFSSANYTQCCHALPPLPLPLCWFCGFSCSWSVVSLLSSVIVVWHFIHSFRDTSRPLLSPFYFFFAEQYVHFQLIQHTRYAALPSWQQTPVCFGCLEGGEGSSQITHEWFPIAVTHSEVYITTGPTVSSSLPVSSTVKRFRYMARWTVVGLRVRFPYD